MTQTTISVPDIGGAEGAEVVEVLVAVGDHVELEQSLIVLESDKASLEIPASAAGKVLELKVAVGDELSEGDAILLLEVAGNEKPAADTSVSAPDDTGSSDSDDSASPAKADAPVEAPRNAGGAKTITVEIPDIGTEDDIDLVEVVVEVGQSLSEGDSLVVLESDKASMEVPAPADGVVTKLLVDAGGTVRRGTPIIEMEVDAESDTSEPAAAEPPKAAASAPSSADQAESTPATASPVKDSGLGSVESNSAAPASGADVYAGPAVRKLAREFGITLSEVSGSGPRGRLVKEDLHAFVKQRLSQPAAGGQARASGSGIPVVPDVDFSKFGAIDPQPRSRIDKVTANNMTRSWLNVPHVTQFDDADITELEAFRASMKAEAEKRGTKLTPLPFILKACAVALNANPKLKTSLADGGETLVWKNYCHIGMAVDTPAGLVVPVLRDVDKKSVWEISDEVLELATLARDKKLKPDQMQGGVFSVSSLGNIGGRGFTPVVNTPEVAILGVSRADIRPVWDGSAFVPRKQLPLALSYDHRVVNGGDAGRFLTQLRDLLSDIRRILL